MTLNDFLAVRDSIVLGYTADTYRLFRGKTADKGYG